VANAAQNASPTVVYTWPPLPSMARQVCGR
jgi:hypothetical protein